MSNKWRDFANLHNMSEDDFTDEIIEVAQAVLAMELKKNHCAFVTVSSKQQGKKYKLTFEEIK